MQHVAVPDEHGVRDADGKQHEQAAHVDQPRIASASLLESLELDRKADREQQAEQAVELAGEQHLDDEQRGRVPRRRRLLTPRSGEARHVDDENAE